MVEFSCTSVLSYMDMATWHMDMDMDMDMDMGHGTIVT